MIGINSGKISSSLAVVGGRVPASSGCTPVVSPRTSDAGCGCQAVATGESDGEARSGKKLYSKKYIRIFEIMTADRHKASEW